VKKKQTYTFLQLAAVLMTTALLWLTVSAPFVNSHQQKIAKQVKRATACSANAGSEEEAANPFGNNTEEKVPDSNSLSEYLHDHARADHFACQISRYCNVEKAGIYIAFHGEILAPPPNKA
jgi:hypothetical protein